MSLVLVGDRRMSSLHVEFMGIAGPTDVLTFAMETDGAARVTSGEVIVCVPEAQRQARKRNLMPRLELLLYSLHGMLHLTGYDDRTSRAYRTMHRIEDAILTQLGFGPVFAASGPVSAVSGRSRGGRR
jgi:probable rRNA maturation factor